MAPTERDTAPCEEFSLCVDSTNLLDTSTQPDMTTWVGTFFYTAPEIGHRLPSSRFSYDQKVDIYSLGIIFFEMLNSPFSTQRERDITLRKLRSAQVVFPVEFGSDPALEKEVRINSYIISFHFGICFHLSTRLNIFHTFSRIFLNFEVFWEQEQIKRIECKLFLA